jgi:hypothetical protein
MKGDKVYQAMILNWASKKLTIVIFESLEKAKNELMSSLLIVINQL